MVFDNETYRSVVVFVPKKIRRKATLYHGSLIVPVVRPLLYSHIRALSPDAVNQRTLQLHRIVYGTRFIIITTRARSFYRIRDDFVVAFPFD